MPPVLLITISKLLHIPQNFNNMTKILSLLILAMFAFFNADAFSSVNPEKSPASGNSTLFSLDEAKMNAEMSDLNQLEEYVLSHEGTTYSELTTENNPLVRNESAVNGMDVEDVLAKGGGMPTWAIVLIVVGGILILCCVIYVIAAASTVE